ncbi:MAG: 1-acyl-sn-glycerol-3-phosphate acyltransferase [Kiritimatiellaeota bacterium]|nr:1-acyl-sn-glycerol-3-phosphate acyltransferase [Kiritimatiellota bacterium]
MVKTPLFSPTLFCDALRQTGAYDAPPGRRPLPSVAATPLFYAGILSAYYRGWRESFRPAFSNRLLATISHSIWGLCASLGGAFDVSGFTRLPPAAVYVSNHASQLETYLLPGILLAFGDIAVVLKEEITRYPFLGRIARKARSIAIGRANPVADLRKVLTDGEAALREGRNVLIFPQGTRRPLFAPESFNTIGARLAQRAGVPLVPVAVKTDFLPIGKPFRDLSPVRTKSVIRIRCGTPVPPTESPKDAHAQCLAHITDTLRAWQSLDGVPLL